MDASTSRKEALQHAFPTLLSPGVPQQLSHRSRASTAGRQHFPAPCRQNCPNWALRYPEDLPGQPEQLSDCPGPGAAREARPGRPAGRTRGSRATVARQACPRVTLGTLACNYLKEVKTGDAAGRRMGVGEQQARGTSTLGGCEPGGRKGRCLPGLIVTPTSGLPSLGSSVVEGTELAKREAGSGRVAHPPAKR